MREILFRGKGNPKYNDGSWYDGYLKYDGEDYQILDAEYGSCARTVLPETVGQFTGLTDKNGRKIFEGDILKANNGHIGYVAFSEGGFVKACRCHFNFTNLYGDNQEVIDNIHDNPELIGGEEN